MHNVRNFWIELNVGRAKPITVGPVGRTGGFTLTIHQREHGTLVPVLHITGGMCEEVCALHLTAHRDYNDPSGSHLVFFKVTER